MKIILPVEKSSEHSFIFLQWQWRNTREVPEEEKNSKLLMNLYVKLANFVSCIYLAAKNVVVEFWKAHH